MKSFLLLIISFSTCVFLGACGSSSNSSSTTNPSPSAEAIVTSDPTCSAPVPPERQYPKIQRPENLRLVTGKYGLAEVRTGEVIYKADEIGWASWWYPAGKNDFSSGIESPLTAYDQWTRNFGPRPTSSSLVQNQRQQKDAESWEGYCSPRAFAALMEPMVKKSVRVNGQCFSPAQLKALALLTYEKVSPQSWDGIYGQNFSEGHDNVFADIYPDQLLRLLQVNLQDRKKALLMDHDAGSEVWMDSVHKAYINVRKSENEHELLLNLVLHMPKYLLSEKERRLDAGEGLSSTAAVTTREYEAKLYGCWHGESFLVSSSEWIGKSVNDHPDYAIEIPDEARLQIKKQRGSFNSEIQVSEVDALLKKALEAESRGEFCSLASSTSSPAVDPVEPPPPPVPRYVTPPYGY